MWNDSIENVLKVLNSKTEGITQKQADEQTKKDGKNEIPKGKKKTIGQIFLQQFWSPIILILVVAAIFSIVIRSDADAIFIFIVIAINAIIGTTQEWNSEKSAEKLQNMIKIKTKVIRDGKVKEINSEDIVLGDIVNLESGSKIPADLRLIETKNLSIDESILTRRNKSKK